MASIGHMNALADETMQAIETSADEFERRVIAGEAPRPIAKELLTAILTNLAQRIVEAVVADTLDEAIRAIKQLKDE